MGLRRNAFLLLLLTVLIAVTGQWALDTGAQRYWRLPAALLLLGLAYEGLLTRRAAVALQVRAPARWPLARAAVVTVALCHRWSRPLVLELAADAPEDIDCDRSVHQLTIPAGGLARVELTGVPRRLGRREWPALRGRLAGPLGLAWWPCVLRDPYSLVVVPELLEHSERALGATVSGVRASTRIGVGGEVLQLRSFRAGDALRVIDWKATARRRALIARDFTEDQHLDIMVGIDAGRASGIWCGNLDRLGHYINVAARFAQHAIEQDDRVGIVVFADRPLAALPPGRGIAAVSRIRRLLGAVQVQSMDSNPIHATARIRTLVRHRSLVILLTDIDDAASSGQLVSALRLLQPKHLPFVVAVVSNQLQQLARAAPGDWLGPFEALAAQEQSQRRERSVLALRARGVPALVTPPEQLPAALFDAYANFRRQRRV